jgi:hypothetical protein
VRLLPVPVRPEGRPGLPVRRKVQAGRPGAPPRPRPKFPQAVVPDGCRAVNVTGRQCVWCALESVARTLGVDELSNVTRDHPGPSGSLGSRCDPGARSGVPFDSQRPAGAEALCAFLGKHVGGRPARCAVGVYGGAHCLVCVGFEPGNERVALIGNVPFGCEVREYAWESSWRRFNPDGWAFTLTGGKVAAADRPADKSVTTPAVTVEETPEAVYVYRSADPADRFVLKPDASADLIRACVKRMEGSAPARPPANLPAVAPTPMPPPAGRQAFQPPAVQFFRPGGS